MCKTGQRQVAVKPSRIPFISVVHDHPMARPIGGSYVRFIKFMIRLFDRLLSLRYALVRLFIYLFFLNFINL